MKNLVFSILMLIFAGCEDGSNSKTIIYKVDCNEKGCICSGLSGTYENKGVDVFKCDSSFTVGDTIPTISIKK